MTQQTLIQRIVEIAESQGFSVNTEVKGNDVEFTFSQYTDFGQDFSFWATMQNYDITTLMDDVYGQWESYDPDEEALLWVGPDGHGKNGAPYRLTDVVKDMEQCEQMIDDLWNALCHARDTEDFEIPNETEL